MRIGPKICLTIYMDMGIKSCYMRKGMLFSEKYICLADEKNEDKNIFAFELEFH